MLVVINTIFTSKKVFWYLKNFVRRCREGHWIWWS